MKLILPTIFILTSSLHVVLGETYHVMITVSNPAPQGGTCLTPPWFGIHDGTFDTYDRGAPARESVERLAEDGNNEPLMEEFGASNGFQSQGTIGDGPICPGEQVVMPFTIETSGSGPYYFSYASMILPSNDAWVSNGNPMSYELIDAEGDFMNASIIVSGSDVLDAGTEENDEIPENTAFFGQSVADSGVPEGGVVSTHQGFLPAGSGGILDNPDFASADFTVEGYEALSIDIVLAPPIVYTGSIVVSNPAPEGGTCITPVWLGIHNGSFEIFVVDSPASEAVERLAEDGNVTPLSEDFTANVGSSWQTTVGDEPICPGEQVVVPFTLTGVGTGPYYLSYASMVVPSNDAFIANEDTQEYEIIGSDGSFYPQDIIVYGMEVYDAGTEENDEIPENTALLGQVEPNTGADEEGVVEHHPGFLPSGSGGILDTDGFTNADFTSDGYEVLRVQMMLDTPKTYKGIIYISNPAPETGTCITPPWIGIHDGSFDTYDRDAPAREAVERLAEDGNNVPIMEEFNATIGSQWQATIGDGPICPGEEVAVPFTITTSGNGPFYLSYASMVLPSNDAWVSNGDPMAYELIDADGVFLNNTIIVAGSEVLDAGTEENDEIPENTAFFGQEVPDTGAVESGVITSHAGFHPAGSGGILDSAEFANADFTVNGYEVLKIRLALDEPKIHTGTIILRNPAPEGGTCLTPIWVGIHDGSFDLYDRDSPVRESVERLAEDGDAGMLISEFAEVVGGQWQNVLGDAPICPGEQAVLPFSITTNSLGPYYLSYAAMVLPSNDAWVANGDPMAYELIDASGAFIDTKIEVGGSDVLDAGTEMNDEIPENTAFFGQTEADSGVEEGGVVISHPGFLPIGSGGILDSPEFVNADFTVDGYQVLEIEFTSKAPVQTYSGKVIFTNKAPEGGTCQTPSWVGFHDGTFDLYDRDEPASEAIERLAEDGDPVDLSEEFASSPGAIWQGVVGDSPICPGESVELSFVLEDIAIGYAYYFSYASMVLPSNDAWLANGNPLAYEVIDASGNFKTALILETGADVLDAGTEVNDEIPENTAFFGQVAPDTGMEEGGNITLHSGFNPVGSGGILDDPLFVNADFTVDGYEMFEIRVLLDLPTKRYAGRVSISNNAPLLGTCLTPTWVGIHDGTFDTYDGGSPARESIERLAEDGNSELLLEEFAVAFGGVWDDTVGGAPICPGSVAELDFEFNITVGVPLYFSYATMILPSNDAWVSNGNPMEYAVFNSEGMPSNITFTVSGTEVLDAGTEVNDELANTTAFLNQTIPNTGDPEDGVVLAHPGFKAMGSGGILDYPDFANADFTADGYEVMTVTVEFMEITEPPTTTPAPSTPMTPTVPTASPSEGGPSPTPAPAGVTETEEPSVSTAAITNIKFAASVASLISAYMLL